MELSLAARDLELLRLRQITFGDTLRGTLPCAACGTRLETEISVQSMIDRLEALRPTSRTTVAAGGFTLLMRPVNSRDLSAILTAADPRRRLLALCTSVDSPETSVQDVLGMCEHEAVEQFNRLNESAETRFSVPCPSCSATDRVELDIARFLWAEVRHSALILLREVHELASAYGWTERSILDMSPARRASYLEMVRA